MHGELPDKPGGPTSAPAKSLYAITYMLRTQSSTSLHQLVRRQRRLLLPQCVKMLLQDRREFRTWYAAKAAVSGNAEVREIFARSHDPLSKPFHVMNDA